MGGLRTRYVLSFFALMFVITVSYQHRICKSTINVKEWDSFQSRLYSESSLEHSEVELLILSFN